MVISTGPILITVLAGVFLKEGFPPGLLAGCVRAFAGCVLIGLSGSRTGSLGGIALLMIAAVAYATAVVIQKPGLAAVGHLVRLCVRPAVPAVSVHGAGHMAEGGEL